MAIYYVSNSGNDSNVGTNTGSTFRTISKINTLSLNPGDSIFFKCGDIWREQLKFQSINGNSGETITIGSYGTGNKPKIYGSINGDVLGYWTNIGGNKWASTNSSFPNESFMVLYNTNSTPQFCNRKTGTTYLTSNWDFWYDSVVGRIVIYNNAGSPNSQADGIEICGVFNSDNIGTIIHLDSCNYWKIENLDIEYSNDSYIKIHQCNNISISNCDGRYSWGRGIDSYGNNNLLENLYLYHTGYANKILNSSSESIKMWGDSETIYRQTGSIVRNNNIEMSHNIGVCVSGVDGVFIENNYIDGVDSYPIEIDNAGIYLNESTNSICRYNIVTGSFNKGFSLSVETSGLTCSGITLNNNISINSEFGYILNSQLTYKSTYNNYFYNNLTYNNISNRTSVKIGQNVGNVFFKNNIFYDVSNSGTYMLISNSTSSEIFFDYNCWYSSDITSYIWNNVTYSNYDLYKSASGQEKNSIKTNPLFVSPGVDFRLQSNSPALNSGVNVGFSYSNYAPDMGVNENQFYYIDPNGSDTTGVGSMENPWASLYYACSNVISTGSTIYIKSGNYLELSGCSLSIGVNIVGNGEMSVIKSHHITQSRMYGYSTASIYLVSPSEGTYGNQSISNITLDGELIGSIGILIKKRSNVKIHNCIIKNFYVNGVTFLANNSPYTEPTILAEQNELYECVIDNCGDTATTWDGGALIQFSGQYGLSIHDNILTEISRTVGHNGNIINGGWYDQEFKYYNNKSYKLDDESNSWNFHIEFWNNFGKAEIYNNEFHGGWCAIDCAGNNSDEIGGYSWSIHDNLFTPLNGSLAPREAYWIVIECKYTYKTLIYNNNFEYGYYSIVVWSLEAQDIFVYNNNFKKSLYSLRLTASNDNQFGTDDTIFKRIYFYQNVLNLSNTSGYFYGSMGLTARETSSISDVYIYNNTFVTDNIIHMKAIEITNGAISGTTIPITGGTINNINIKNNIFCYFSNQGTIGVINNGILDGLYIENNLFYNSGNATIYYYWPYSIGSMNNYVYINNIPSTTGGTQQNPLFISNIDYRLQSNSPAINTGQNVGLPYIGLAPDMGAFEYNGIYFDSIYGDDNGSGTTSSPYKSISKLNSILSSVENGSTIYLRCGSEWSGSGTTINITKSGAPNSGITITSYGTGEKPIISGFETLTGWTNEGGGIYSKMVYCDSTPNIITIDGIQYGMGRYPKYGTDLIYESSNTNISITSSSLDSIITNWTGAEAYIRKSESIADRCKITNHTNQTLTYVSLGTQSNSTPGYYFFIQNDLKCVTQFGDWYYNSGNTKIYVYFGINNPEIYKVKIPVVSQLFVSHSKSYITVSGLTFEGTSTGKGFEGGGVEPAAVFIDGTSSYYTIKYCDFNFCGANGITLQSNNSIIDNNIMNYISRTAIEPLSNFVNITNNKISNVGIIEGTAWCGTRATGIWNWGNDCLVQYNTINGVAGIAIPFWGSRVVIKNNYITNWSIFMNNTGSIYTDGSISGYISRVIEGNIIIGGYGKMGISAYGQMVTGIYLDSYSHDILVKDNTISSVGYSNIFISNGTNINLQHNTTYDSAIGISFLEWGSSNSVSGITMNNNIFFSKNITDYSLMFKSSLGTIGNFGISDYNYFVRPILDTTIIQTYEQPSGVWQNRTLSNWQSYTGQDLNSNKSPVSISNTGQLLFEYNTGSTNKVVPLIGNYKDVGGNTYFNSVTISPYSSIILMDTGGIYFDSVNGNDSWSGTTTYPYKSISKLNSILSTVVTGTTIYLKRGSVWTGSTITPNKSGTLTSPIVIDVYGTGEKPIISGFQTIDGWIQSGTTGIWYKTISPQSIPNIVTVDGINTPKGRFPNSNYLTIDSFTGSTDISSSSLNSSSVDWTGAELVIRKNRYIIERCPITKHLGNKITYTSPSNFYDAIVGYGFFIQNDKKCLTEFGDWFYSGNTIYMYFGGDVPTNHTVKVSVLDELLLPGSHIDYISVKNIIFEGANTAAIHTNYNDFFNIDGCSILYSGNVGYYAQTGGMCGTINNCTFNHSNYVGIRIEAGILSSGYTVTNNTILNTGILTGMGQPIGADFTGIIMSSHNSLIKNNIIDTCGYCGISLNGNKGGMIINENFINNYLTVKDDGGAIYTWIDSYNNHTNCYITNNIITKGIGNHDGVYSGHTTYLAQGIYLDNYSENYIVSGNTCAYSISGGIFLGLFAKNCQIEYNTSFNNKYQLWSIGDNEVMSRGFIIKNNIFFASTTSQYMTLIDQTNPNLLGNVDYNYWCRPINENDIFWMSNPSYHYDNLSQWKSEWGIDINSKSSPISIDNTNQIFFEYNTGNTIKSILLDGAYMRIDGSIVSNNITIYPYSSIILLKMNVVGNNLLILDITGKIRLSVDSKIYITI